MAARICPPVGDLAHSCFTMIHSVESAHFFRAPNSWLVLEVA